MRRLHIGLVQGNIIIKIEVVSAVLLKQEVTHAWKQVNLKKVCQGLVNIILIHLPFDQIQQLEEELGERKDKRLVQLLKVQITGQVRVNIPSLIQKQIKEQKWEQDKGQK